MEEEGGEIGRSTQLKPNSTTAQPQPSPNPNHDENDNHSEPATAVAEENLGAVASAAMNTTTRTPFSNLSQVDADLALARTLQEQERAYMMLRMHNDEGSDYGSWETSSELHEDDFDDTHIGTDVEDDDDHVEQDENGDDEDEDNDDDDDDDGIYVDDDEDEDEDAFDANAHDDENDTVEELDPSAFPDDESFARALQDAEEREMAARLLALAYINERGNENAEVHGGNLQDTWEEVDPDELSYEELLALGEIVGTESRGLSASSIATLPSISYKKQTNQDGNNDSCVICRLDFEEGDTLTVLSCKHLYHPECINNWLQINKVCPVCSTEVSASENR